MALTTIVVTIQLVVDTDDSPDEIHDAIETEWCDSRGEIADMFDAAFTGDVISTSVETSVTRE